MAEKIYNEKLISIYGDDPREMPLYGLTDASRYLKIPVNTLKSWISGRYYPLQDGKAWWPPVIHLPKTDIPLLSFYNLVEVHVLSGIRRVHNVQFRKVREALKFLESLDSNKKHPLATNDFWTDRFDVFIKESGNLICASRNGQMVIREVVERYLHRIQRDIDLTPFRLYPFSQDIKVASTDSLNHISRLEEFPRNIVIDPLIAFGRPTVSGIATNVIAGRFKAGENIKELSKDYEIEEAQIKDALNYEGVSSRAA